ncbi:transcription termination/antitermination protein NusG [Methylocella tundrae]|uniref:NusG-like N-terminal domain-containing protein n=1 Tax=Methylocella tundrae TaxID=227605 RepID=A0A4V6IM51_METTU|nr:transcription termination/antitermination NusG family protein [Methylocella tundrae]WPP04783.1 transcription termination/antitermination NusG family protein [Methylocella tundrae]VFU06999.1 conserved protein of unknown function [Methylocella tundrae]
MTEALGLASSEDRDWYAAWMNAKIESEMGRDDGAALACGASVVWYVAYTNVKSEKRAAEGLTRKGFETFLPVGLKRVKLRKKRVLASRLMFPRYLFIGFPEGSSWYLLRQTDGIEAVLANDGRPLAVPTPLIVGMQREQMSGVYDERDPAKIGAGDEVKFTHGAFGGRRGRCVAIAGTRAEVVIELLKREVVVKIGLDQLINVV